MQSSNKTKNIIAIIILIIAIVVGSIIYSKYNFNDFTKSVREKGKLPFLVTIKKSILKYQAIKLKIKNTMIPCFTKR